MFHRRLPRGSSIVTRSSAAMLQIWGWFRQDPFFPAELRRLYAHVVARLLAT